MEGCILGVSSINVQITASMIVSILFSLFLVVLFFAGIHYALVSDLGALLATILFLLRGEIEQISVIESWVKYVILLFYLAKMTQIAYYKYRNMHLMNCLMLLYRQFCLQYMKDLMNTMHKCSEDFSQKNLFVEIYYVQQSRKTCTYRLGSSFDHPMVKAFYDDMDPVVEISKKEFEQVKKYDMGSYAVQFYSNEMVRSQVKRNYEAVLVIPVKVLTAARRKKKNEKLKFLLAIALNETDEDKLQKFCCKLCEDDVYNDIGNYLKYEYIIQSELKKRKRGKHVLA